MGIIHYKFKSEKGFKQHSFDGIKISLLNLKNEIVKEMNLGLLEDYDLVVKNAQTNEEYADEDTLIPRNTSVIIRRVPLSKGKMSKARTTQVLAAKEKEIQESKAKLMEKIALGLQNGSGFDLTEEEKINEMMAQSEEAFGQQSDILALKSSAKPVRFKGKMQLPANYICFNCGKKGHLNKYCDVAEKPFAKVKKTTGIPRNLLRPVEEGEKAESALVTPEGTFVTAFADERAWKMTASKNRQVSIDPEKVPEELKCFLCRIFTTSPVLFPCCSVNCCEDCVKETLASSLEEGCPSCKRELRPNELKINKPLKENATSFLKKQLEGDRKDDKEKDAVSISYEGRPGKRRAETHREGGERKYSRSESGPRRDNQPRRRDRRSGHSRNRR